MSKKKGVSKLDKYRCRNFCLVLYDEDETHKKAIKYIQKHYDYAMILHDKDKLEDGSIKKEHYHFVLRFKNATWNTALSKELGITENYIEECRDLKCALQYLIHYNEETKYQYNLENVTGSLKKKLEEYINSDDKTEHEKAKELIQYINSCDFPLTITEFCLYCSSIGVWDVYRRAQSTFKWIIDEHNIFVNGEMVKQLELEEFIVHNEIKKKKQEAFNFDYTS